MWIILLLQINASTELTLLGGVQHPLDQKSLLMQPLIQNASYVKPIDNLQNVSRDDEHLLRVIQLYEALKKQNSKVNNTSFLDLYDKYKPWVDALCDWLSKACTLKWFKDSFFAGTSGKKEEAHTEEEILESAKKKL